MNMQSYGITKVPILGPPLGNRRKVTFGCNPYGEAHNIPIGCLIVVTFPFNGPHVTRLRNVELMFISQFLVGY